MRCPDCFELMDWNREVNGYVCPAGCFAAYGMTCTSSSGGQVDAVVDYMENVNFAEKETDHGY
jgi:hypothetical protein